ncbi:MAG: winged helix-turn-helix transcriptional regulator [Candidatus Lokiarchaeota archaeon]|nr:winged helix-turn-helix transcriptional regulator [Candidatus Lokiarchaeota archaeon]
MGRRPGHNAAAWFIAVAAVTLFLAQCVGIASARVEQVPGFIVTDTIRANEGVVLYNFTGNNQYAFSSDVDVHLTLSIGIPLRFQHVNVTINASSDMSLFAQNFEYFLQFVDPWFYDDGKTTRYDQRWGSYLFFLFSETGGRISLGVPVGEEYGISATDKWSVYDNSSWHVLPTTLVGGTWLVTDVEINESACFFSVFASNVTATQPDEPPTGNDEFVKQQQALATGMMSAGAVLAALTLVAAAASFSGKEYREFIKARASRDVEARHKLTIDEVLENENRVLIIDAILQEPGVHFNELMRRTDLAPGNLVWHLEVLCDYKVIGKKSVGQYVVYFPLSLANPIKDIDITLVKSKVTLQILNIIEAEPGIYGNIIAKRLGLDHKTVKYHVDKLVEAKLVVAEKDGRTRKLAPRLQTTFD